MDYEHTTCTGQTTTRVTNMQSLNNYEKTSNKLTVKDVVWRLNEDFASKNFVEAMLLVTSFTIELI